MFCPGIWTPVVESLDSDGPVETANASKPPSVVHVIPKPHWAEDHSPIQKIRQDNEFRTSLNAGGEFVPLQSRDTIEVEALPEIGILETQAPVPPIQQDDWEILELIPESESSHAVMGAIEVPQILPETISDEVLGQVTPLLSEPEFVGHVQPNSTVTSPPSGQPWWVEHVQSPQLPNRTPQGVNLDQVIWMALQQAPEIQVLNSQPEVRRTVIDQSIAKFDWSAFVESVWTDTNEPVGSLLTTGSAGGRFTQQEFAFEGGLKKRLATGGDLRLAQSFGRTDNNSSFLQPPDQSVSRLEIDYRQPLMRGAGTRYATTQIVLAKLDFEQVESQSLERIQNYLIEVVAAYWDLYRQRAVLTQNRESLIRAQALHQQLQQQGASADAIARVESAISTRQTEQIRAEFQVLNAQDRLVNLTLGSKSEQTQTIELIPEPMTLPDYRPAHVETLTYVALRNRPEVSQAVSKIKAASAREYVAINELLPQLDAILSTYVSGLRGGFDGNGAFNDQFSAGDPSYSVGFGFELPVGNRVAKSKLQRQQLQTKILGHQFQKTIGDVVLDVRISTRNVERLSREIQTNQTAMARAQQELELITQRQRQSTNQAGTTSLLVDDLLASQIRLTSAEQRLLTAQTEYAIALVDLKRATGELVNGKFHADTYLPPSLTEMPSSPSNSIPVPMEAPPAASSTTGMVPGSFEPARQSPIGEGNLVPASNGSFEATPQAVPWHSQDR